MPQVGEPFFVYRVGHMDDQETLEARVGGNAASAGDLLSYLGSPGQEDELATVSHVFVYEVTLRRPPEEYQPQQPLFRLMAAGILDHVGFLQGEDGAMFYSFGAEGLGYDSDLHAAIPLERIGAGVASFGDTPSATLAAAVEQAFAADAEQT